MNKEFAHKFSLEWVAAWNSHNLGEIMAHYADGFEMNSPVIRQIMNEPSGILKGKNNVRNYWEKALKMNSNLHFEIEKVYSGVNSVIIQYKGHRVSSAEMFFFNEEGKVISAYAHYE